LWTLLIIFQTPVHIFLKQMPLIQGYVVPRLKSSMLSCRTAWSLRTIHISNDKKIFFSVYSFLYHRQDFHLTLIWVTRCVSHKKQQLLTIEFTFFLFVLFSFGSVHVLRIVFSFLCCVVFLFVLIFFLCFVSTWHHYDFICIYNILSIWYLPHC
jgi:hypothetical protein